ncbi:MAG: PspC domain-containing protein [Deltaproteobacteria bacterium]|nr:PspC domain-containing protein [Deltaproteobacteria bacterium]
MTNSLAPSSSKKLVRSDKQRMFLGVCGGIAEYFDVDPTVVRVAWVVVSIVSAAVPGILLYLVLAALMPRASETA